MTTPCSTRMRIAAGIDAERHAHHHRPPTSTHHHSHNRESRLPATHNSATFTTAASQTTLQTNLFTKSAHPNIHKQSADVSRTAIQLQTHDASHHTHAHHHEYHHKSTRLRLAALTTRTDRQTNTSNTELCHGKVRRASLENCSRGRLEMFTAHTKGLLQYRHPGMRPRRNTPTNLLDASPAFSTVRARPTAPLPNMTLDSQPNPLRLSAPKSISKISAIIRRLFFGGWWYDDERLSQPRALALAALRDTIPTTPRSHSTTNMSTSHNVNIDTQRFPAESRSPSSSFIESQSSRQTQEKYRPYTGGKYRLAKKSPPATHAGYLNEQVTSLAGCVAPAVRYRIEPKTRPQSHSTTTLSN